MDAVAVGYLFLEDSVICIVNVKYLQYTSMVDESINNNMERLHWNTSHYASQYPYLPLDEFHLRHLVNFTIMKGLNYSNSDPNSSLLPDIECTPSSLFNLEFLATLHVMYWTIFIIAILGNGMVCFIVCQSSRMQTVTNYFIANLAIADMSMAFLCIPSSFISQSIQ